MIKNPSKWAAAMALAEEANEKSQEAMQAYKETGNVAFLNEAEKYADSYNQYQFYAAQGCF